MNDITCKNCDHRYPGCQEKCEKYHQFKKMNKEKLTRKAMDNLYSDYINDAKWRMKTRRRTRHDQ